MNRQSTIRGASLAVATCLTALAVSSPERRQRRTRTRPVVTAVYLAGRTF